MTVQTPPGEVESPETAWRRHLAPPRHMLIEASSRCNYICPLCLWTKNKNHGFLDAETFASFLEQAGPSLELMCFSGRGEPTMNPNLYELLGLAVAANVPTDLATNGSSLLRDVDAILDSGIDNVNVSIDADNPEDYVRYRVRGKFDEVVAGMSLLAEEKRRRGLDKPRLRTVSVLFGYNSERLPDLRRFFADLGFESFIFKSAHLGHGQLAKSEEELGREWLPRDPSMVRLRNGDHAGGPPVCGFLHRGHLLWNGDVCRCGIDHVRMIAGNIREQSFEEIWTGPKSASIVQEIVGGRFDKCAGCWLNGERHATETDGGMFLI